MNELRLPVQASSVSLQTALTRSLDSVSTFLHAARISESHLLGNVCRDLAEHRSGQAERIAAMIEREGGTPDFGPSREAGFQRIWMTLVSRRFPTFREGLPRECERSDRRLERVLLRLLNVPGCEKSLRGELAAILREVRADLARLRRLRHPRAGMAAAGPGQAPEISQDRADLSR
jgi:hypothetical protein